jgi:class 3 adenylate cyclase
VKIIRNNDGEITAFDGDRVMGVFIGGTKNTSAAKAALQINAFVAELNLIIKRAYPDTGYVLRQSVGVDTSKLFVARTGVRNHNDLVWVGRAANYAAKLCSLGDDTFPVHVTEAVFSKLMDDAKYGGQPRRMMWEKTMWNATGLVVYRSNWVWKF